jgi:hypothetical protein
VPAVQSWIIKLDEELCSLVRSNHRQQKQERNMHVFKVFDYSDYLLFSSNLTSLAMNHLTYSYTDTMKNLSKTKKLLIVRDPWDRLLSAYRDKLEVGITPDQLYYQEAYGKDMVAKYRREGLERFGEDCYGTNLGSPFSVKGRTMNEPTFWEFVQAIIREGESIRHELELYQPEELFDRSD